MRRPMRTEEMLVYNIFPLLAGKFGEWAGHMERAVGMGFNWIFVNPIHAPGFSGSIYSIKDYFSFNPILLDQAGGLSPWEQVREMMSRAEGLGLKMMADLVVNHCAVDSELLKEHPEWFEWKKNGQVVNPSANENGRRVFWEDLAKFDHRRSRDKEGLYRFFFRVVVFLADLGFRGFRCDAAYQVPDGFWRRLIKETKSRYPGTMFFAETLGCTAEETRKTALAGFDFIFNSSKWWDMQSPWLLEQYNLTREIAPSIGFPENHDTLRLADETDGNTDALRQRYIFSALFSTGVMITMGFEFGFRRKPHVVKTRPCDWEDTDIDLTSFIREVNRLKTEHPVFREEAPTERLHYKNPSILLLWKGPASTTEEALIIINKDVREKQRLYVGNPRSLLQSSSPLTDVSPQPRFDHIPEPFSYVLRPGQCIVLAARRKTPPMD